jgi:hypothetical protein
MPVIAVALAASSFIGAAAAATAVGASMATMVAAGAVMAGSAMTIVGTITGNAKLTKIGAIVGLVGGIGGAIAGSMQAGATAAAESATDVAGELAQGTATDAATSAAGDAIQTSAVDLGSDITSTAGSSAAGSASTSMATTGATSASGAAPGSLLSAATPAGEQAASAGANAAASTTTDVLSTGNVAQQAGQASMDAGSTAVGQSFKNANNLLSGNADIAGGNYAGATDASGAFSSASMPNMPADGSLLGAVKGYATDMQAWAKANPLLAKAALEGTSALVKGMVPSEAEKAQMAAYKAQTETQKRRALWGSGRTA